MPTPPAASNGGGGGGDGGGSGGGDFSGGSLVDTSQLAEVLAVDRPLEATARAFAETYQPHERFRANCALCIMLQVRATQSRRRRIYVFFFFVLQKPNCATIRYGANEYHHPAGGREMKEKITETLRYEYVLLVAEETMNLPAPRL